MTQAMQATPEQTLKRGAEPAAPALLGLDQMRLVKRSVTIAGHKTSVSLEEVFWLALKASAARRRVSVGALVEMIDARRSGNLSSALRVFLMAERAPPGLDDAAA